MIWIGLGLECVVVKTKPFRFTIGFNGEGTNLHTDVQTGKGNWQTKNGNFLLMTRGYCDFQFGEECR